MRAHRFAVVGAENNDGILCQARLIEGPQQFTHAMIQGCAVGIIALQFPAHRCLLRRWHIGGKLELIRRIHLLILFRSRSMRKMRWAEGDQQDERLATGRLRLDVTLGILRLRERIIAIPEFLLRIVATVIG